MFARGTRIEENRALRRYGMGWLVEHVGATLGATFESGRDAQQSAAQSAQQTARDTQRKTAEETARVIETTAPKNGSIPIADYE